MSYAVVTCHSRICRQWSRSSLLKVPWTSWMTGHPLPDSALPGEAELDQMTWTPSKSFYGDGVQCSDLLLGDIVMMRKKEMTTAAAAPGEATLDLHHSGMVRPPSGATRSERSYGWRPPRSKHGPGAQCSLRASPAPASTT